MSARQTPTPNLNRVGLTSLRLRRKTNRLIILTENLASSTICPYRHRHRLRLHHPPRPPAPYLPYHLHCKDILWDNSISNNGNRSIKSRNNISYPVQVMERVTRYRAVGSLRRTRSETEARACQRFLLYFPGCLFFGLLNSQESCKFASLLRRQINDFPNTSYRNIPSRKKVLKWNVKTRAPSLSVTDSRTCLR